MELILCFTIWKVIKELAPEEESEDEELSSAGSYIACETGHTAGVKDKISTSVLAVKGRYDTSMLPT